MSGLGDLALLIGIERRRPAALAEVCRRHGGPLHAVTARVCGAAVAEPLVAEVLMELWCQPQRFGPDAYSLRASLLGRAHARAAAVARAGRGDAVARPGERLVDHHGDDHAAQVLSGLPEAEQAVIALAYLGGYSCRQIAEALEEPEPVVAARMRSGLRRLAQHRPAPQARR